MRLSIDRVAHRAKKITKVRRKAEAAQVTQVDQDRKRKESLRHSVKI